MEPPPTLTTTDQHNNNKSNNGGVVVKATTTIPPQAIQPIVIHYIQNWFGTSSRNVNHDDTAMNKLLIKAAHSNDETSVWILLHWNKLALDKIDEDSNTAAIATTTTNNTDVAELLYHIQLCIGLP